VLKAVIFDVDGVLVASPPERAWQAALQELMATEWRDLVSSTSYAPERFTTEVYQRYLAGKPRLSGAAAALAFFGLTPTDQRVARYAEYKQAMIDRLIDEGAFTAFKDGVRFVLNLRQAGLRLGVASSSKNANRFMARVPIESAGGCATLLDVFDANVCGRDFPLGKPDPAIFLAAAAELEIEPPASVVVEDAPSGIQAARAGGMLAIGVARLNDEDLLNAEHADLVVRTLDDVVVDSVVNGPPLRRKMHDGPQVAA
jgi:beta-phosphoglucomutase-like phosphatase (HAD superfamily)